MIRVTRWSPDTCGCVLEYEWDDAQDEKTRTHSFKRVVKLCEHHKALAVDKAYDQVVSENTRKNIVFGEVQKIKPDITPDDYTWSFDDKRKLKVGFLGKLQADKRGNLQTQLDSKFGEGKVEVI